MFKSLINHCLFVIYLIFYGFLYASDLQNMVLCDDAYLGMGYSERRTTLERKGVNFFWAGNLPELDNIIRWKVYLNSKQSPCDFDVIVWIAGDLFHKIHDNHEKFLLKTSEIEEILNSHNHISARSFEGYVLYREEIPIRFMFFDDLLNSFQHPYVELYKVLISRGLYVFSSDFARVIILNFFGPGFYCDFDVEPAYFHENIKFFANINDVCNSSNTIIFHEIVQATDKRKVTENSVIFASNSNLFDAYFNAYFLFSSPIPTKQTMEKSAQTYQLALNKSTKVSRGDADFEIEGQYHQHYSLFKEGKAREFAECDMQPQYKDSILFQARYIEHQGEFICRPEDTEVDKALDNLLWFYLSIVAWKDLLPENNPSLSEKMSSYFSIPYRSDFPTVYSWYYPWFKRMIHFHENEKRRTCPTPPDDMAFDCVTRKTIKKKTP